MTLIDIPGALVAALKYSQRSRATFVLSIITSSLTLGLAFDLVYGFVIPRWFHVKDPSYGHFYWRAQIVVMAALPLLAATLAAVRARAKLKPFPRDRFGIAIAPFENFSVDVDTLGTATKLAALDGVISQFFAVSQLMLEQQPWGQAFELRRLPPYTRVHVKAEAQRLADAMGATLVVWGFVVHKPKGATVIHMHLLGRKVDLDLDVSVDPVFLSRTMQFFFLVVAAFHEEAAGALSNARQMLEHARQPAEFLDKHASARNAGAPTNIECVNQWIAKLPNP